MVFIGGINLTEHKPSLKMGGFISINVDVESNDFCAQMRLSDTICKSCYAYYMGTRYPRLKRALVHNYNTLSMRVLTTAEITAIGFYVLARAKGLRFNSMGELINSTHALNLNLIAQFIKAHDPNFPITIWSKRFGLSQEIDRNLIVKIWSNAIVDQPQTCIPESFDAVFNVCTYEFYKAQNKKPNCCGHCEDCMKCYRNKPAPFIVNEMIKRDQTRIKQGKLEVL